MKPLFTILTIVFLTYSCNDNIKSVKADHTEDSVVDGHNSIHKNKISKSQPEIGIIYETENLKLYGDTTIDKDKISYALLKFDPHLSFNDFKVGQIEHKKYAEIDLKSNKYARRYRTVLKEGYSADTANFAGHYSFVYWGCGSPCQNSLVIDRRTGKIYDAPGASVGYDFQVNSRLLIVNPPDSNGYYFDCSYCKPEIYIFDEKTKIFKEQ